MGKITETAQRVLEERYFLKGETEWWDITQRVSHQFGTTDNEVRDFKEVMDNMDFLPNSPALMNAGTEIKAYSACYVLPVEDSIESIFKYYSDAGLISKSGGGVGANFSPIRSSGSIVNSTDGVASGPISFMAGQDALTEVIRQGGRRRGANMGILSCEHEDIWGFVGAKDTAGSLENFNLSVGITDEFMEEVLDTSVPSFDSTPKRLWDELIQRAWSSAEPGVLFMDTIERGNTVPHLGTLEATNPCIAPTETILTREYGHVQIVDVVGKAVHVWNGYEWSLCTPKETGRDRKMLEVSISSGQSLRCTTNHTFILSDGKRVLAENLKIGDKLVKHELPIIEGDLHIARNEAYTRGFFCGDGCSDKNGKQNIWLYGTKMDLEDELIHTAVSYYDGRSLLSNKNYKGYHKDFVPTIEWDVEARLDYLAGLLDSDGCINSPCGAMAISSVDKLFLKNVQDMLQTLGADSVLATMKLADYKELPDGKGGYKKYHCKESYRLSISSTNVKTLRDSGLITMRLDYTLAQPNRDASRFKRITCIEDSGIEERVYCVTEPKNHSIIVSSMITGNCGEQPLLPYESCTLGSINLSNHVCEGHGEQLSEDTWRTQPVVNWEKLEETTRTGVLFLNRILDASEMPIPECQEAMELTRKIGLGIMGLHDMLIQLGLPYDSEEGRKVAGDVMKFIAEEADKFSRELGDGEGCYEGLYTGGLDPDTRIADQHYGHPIRRNANLTTIAPTGTLSMIADCSSGCEPYYAPVTYKTVLDGTEFAMPNKWVQKHMKEGGYSSVESCLGDAFSLFKGAEDIHWSAHVKMQGVLQEHVDSSISKTINMPEDATVSEVKEAYELAYELGCKGITIYRNNSRTSQVLSTTTGAASESASEEPARVDGGDIARSLPDEQQPNSWPPELYKLDLPDDAPARRHRVRVNEETVYINVTEGPEGEPLEIFTKFPYESDPVWNVLCRQLSLSLRYGLPLVDIIKQLDKSVVGVGDMSAKIARVLKKYLTQEVLISEEAGEGRATIGTESKDIRIGLPSSDESDIYDRGSVDGVGEASISGREKPVGEVCPKCDALLVHQGGCASCPLCYWEKCG